MINNNVNTSNGRLMRLKEEEKNFFKIKGNHFTPEHQIFKHKPKNSAEDFLYGLLKDSLYEVKYEFWAPRISPSIDWKTGNLKFQKGATVEHMSNRKWRVLAEAYYYERGSRIATKYERAIILAFMMEKLLEEGISCDRAWEAITCISFGREKNGNYAKERKIISQYEDLKESKITFTGDEIEVWGTELGKIYDIGYECSYCENGGAIIILTEPPIV